jgi:hypothetical protein
MFLIHQNHTEIQEFYTCITELFTQRLHTRGRLTLIFGHDFCSFLKTLVATVTVKCRTAIKALFLYLNLCVYNVE